MSELVGLAFLTVGIAWVLAVIVMWIRHKLGMQE